MFSKKILCAAILFGLATLPLTSPAEAADKDWLTSIKKAKAQAKKEGKLILIEFTGSDWCPPCKMLTASVLSTPKFKTWAKKNVILLYLDFPRRKPISAEQKKHNARLQKKYGIRGYPTVVIADASGKEIGRKVGGSKDPDGYIRLLNKIVAKAKTAKKPTSRPSK
ncbi:MAG: thioredoxin family protein [Planctomycetota bacterium]|nr:thioredoxin family protein [Planctomycetota bacterium]